MTTLIHIIFALELVAGGSQSAPFLGIREPRALMKISDSREIVGAERELKKLSEVRKIILVDELKDMLADNSKLRLDGYEFRAGEPDLKVMAGRAEWFIDQALPLPRDADNSVRRIKERIDMWKAASASTRTVTQQQVEILKAKYKGTIRNGIHPKAYESIQNLEAFLDEWFPYGKPLQQMEGILDVKLPVEGDEAVLLMDSGYSGLEYRFQHDRGTIRVVKRRGIN